MSVSLKRTLSLGSAALMAVALAACGSSNSSSTANDTGGSPTSGTHEQAGQHQAQPCHA